MDTEQALAFLGFATVAAITPGPSNVMLTATGAAIGTLRGIPCLIGVAVGMGLMMFITAFGLGSIVLSYTFLLTAFKWCGVTFLLWLSWKIAVASYREKMHETRPVGFVGAFAFQWLNPKSWLVSTSASGTYLQGDSALFAQAVWIGGLFFAVAIACGSVWLVFGAAMRSFLKSPRLQRIFNICMASLLAASVLLFAW